MATKLKPCPWCKMDEDKEKASRENWNCNDNYAPHVIESTMPKGFVIQCENCGVVVYFATATTVEEAIQYWNERDLDE